jgi:hypothetical protein
LLLGELRGYSNMELFQRDRDIIPSLVYLEMDLRTPAPVKALKLGILFGIALLLVA